MSESLRPVPAPAVPHPAIAKVDHTEDALSRMCSQFRGDDEAVGLNDVEKLVSALAVGMQRLEDAGYQVLTESDIYTAQGAQLTRIGRIVGQPRITDNDDIYRRYVRARIATNRSDGAINTLVRVARLVLGENYTKYMTFKNWGAGSYELIVDTIPVDPTVAQVLINFLVDATAAGVRPIAISTAGTPAGLLRINRAGFGINKGRFGHAADH